jgi:hypothetical protein
MPINLGKGIADGGGYDLDEIKKAEEALGNAKPDTHEFEDVQPIDIEILPHNSVHHTEEYEARIIIISYDQYDNPLRVEIL